LNALKLAERAGQSTVCDLLRLVHSIPKQV
jgi:hypothetical protein